MAMLFDGLDKATSLVVWYTHNGESTSLSPRCRHKISWTRRPCANMIETGE
jgi:hypothetical protein